MHSPSVNSIREHSSPFLLDCPFQRSAAFISDTNRVTEIVTEESHRDCHAGESQRLSRRRVTEIVTEESHRDWHGGESQRLSRRRVAEIVTEESHGRVTGRIRDSRRELEIHGEG
eukprot:1392884-Amorphochlora_amoeboformis.AAC.1